MHRIRHLFNVPLRDKFILMAREQLRGFFAWDKFYDKLYVPFPLPSCPLRLTIWQHPQRRSKKVFDPPFLFFFSVLSSP